MILTDRILLGSISIKYKGDDLMSNVSEFKKGNSDVKLAENIKRYQDDYLREECKAAPLRMQIHLEG